MDLHFCCRRRRFTTIYYFSCDLCDSSVLHLEYEKVKGSKERQKWVYERIYIRHYYCHALQDKIQLQNLCIHHIFIIWCCFFFFLSLHSKRVASNAISNRKSEWEKKKFNLNTTNPFIVVVNQSLWHHAHRLLCLVFIDLECIECKCNEMVSMRYISIQKLCFFFGMHSQTLYDVCCQKISHFSILCGEWKWDAWKLQNTLNQFDPNTHIHRAPRLFHIFAISFTLCHISRVCGCVSLDSTPF